MQSKTLIFHIGTNKTGSSALQEFFIQNKEKLYENLGIYYPQPEKPLWNDEYKIGSGNGQWLFNCAEDSLNDKQNKKVNDLIQKVKENAYTIVSSEFLWLLKDNRALWKHFINKGINVKVIVYLRRQDEYLESVVNQYIKGNSGQVTKYPDCIDELMKAKVPSVRLNYFSRLEEISSVIGRENIIVRIYDRTRFDGGSIYTDFFTV